MKAAVLYGNEDIRYEEWPDPVLKRNCVKVRVKACGICGSDVPRVYDHGAHFYPVVLGHEFSGIVEEAADGVTKVKAGDHVAGVPLIPCMECEDCQRGNYSQCKHYSFIGSREQGAFADYVVLPESNVVKVDPSLSFEQVALFEPCTVALHGLKIADYEGGKNVAILGGGTIGAFTLQWANIFGAAKTVVVGRNKERLRLSEKLGADCLISTLDGDYMKQALDSTDGRGFDYIFETAGNTETMKMAFELAANKAHICMIGTPTRDLCFSAKIWELMNRKEFSLSGSWMSCSSPFPGDEWKMTAHFFADGRLKFLPEMFHAKYQMQDVKVAFGEFQNRQNVKGRILLTNY